MKSVYVILTGVTILFGGCKESGKTTAASSPEHVANVHSKSANHWSYEGETGPEHWKEIEKNSDCGGFLQSPINIVNYELDRTLPNLSVHYTTSTHIHDVVNNGHTIQYNFDVGDFIELGDNQYELMQFHFHEPAEHLIDGIRYPMELHLVHKSADGAYAVLSVMAKEGASSEPFDFLERHLPLEVGDIETVDMAFDMNLNLPRDKTYFTYEGSLTTPPCTENVRWIIFREPITVSLQQVEELRKLMPLNNYRDEQPRNNRPILLSSR